MLSTPAERQSAPWVDRLTRLRARSRTGSAEAPFAAFGVFDGHGGKFAASHAAKELLGHVMAAVDRWPPADAPGPDPTEGPPANGAAKGAMVEPSGAAEPMVAATQGLAQGARRAAAAAGVPEEAMASAGALWRLQDELLERLPQARPLLVFNQILLNP